jgi:outer membrane murein-binding lipoprotein Lpp
MLSDDKVRHSMEQTHILADVSIPWLYGIASAAYGAVGVVKGALLAKKINKMASDVKNIKDPVRKLQTQLRLLNAARDNTHTAMEKSTGAKKQKFQITYQKYTDDINKLQKKLKAKSMKESVGLDERVNVVGTSLRAMITWPVLSMAMKKKMETMFYHCNELDKEDRVGCQITLLKVLISELGKEYAQDKGNHRLHNQLQIAVEKLKELQYKNG